MSVPKEKNKKTRGFRFFNMLYTFCGRLYICFSELAATITIVALSVRSDIHYKLNPNKLFKITKFSFKKLINLIRLMFKGSDKIVGPNVIYFIIKHISPFVLSVHSLKQYHDEEDQ